MATAGQGRCAFVCLGTDCIVPGLTVLSQPPGPPLGYAQAPVCTVEPELHAQPRCPLPPGMLVVLALAPDLEYEQTPARSSLGTGWGLWMRWRLAFLFCPV